MSEIKIVIADSRGGLDGVAQKQGATVIAGTARPFTSLSTHTSAGFWPPNKKSDKIVATQKDGWLALAT